jgi:ABC-2 type transport system ATP-binding protein
MPDGDLLEFTGITKSFGAVTAVQDFTARVEPGVVTGFLGPNGAGKTTTLRMLLGLVRPTSGRATIGGRAYADLPAPLRTVGAALEAASFHPGRTAAGHLRVYAQAAGLPRARVDEALGAVGLGDVAGRKVGGYSLGMRQRLGLAFALLGDPGVLVLDEPSNGLDPEGIIWMRGLLRALARQGRTVLISSHLLAEVQQTADRLLIISQGRLVFQGALDELADPAEQAAVVDSPDRAALSRALVDAGLVVEVLRSGLTVRGGDPVEIGRIALGAGIALSALQRRGPGLEQVFLELVSGERVHPSAGGLPIFSAPLQLEGGAADETAPGDAAAPAAANIPASAIAEGTDPEHDAEVEEALSAELDPPLVAEDPDIEVPLEEATDEGAPLDETPEQDPSAGDPGADADEPSAPGFTVASTGVIEVAAIDEEGDRR